MTTLNIQKPKSLMSINTLADKLLPGYCRALKAVATLIFVGAMLLADTGSLQAAESHKFFTVNGVVQILQTGSGGQRTDGATIGAQAAGTTVQFSFGKQGSATVAAPCYQIRHLLAPNRIVLLLHGVRNSNMQEIKDSLLQTGAIREVYSQVVLDDSAKSFVFVLKKGYTYQFTEYAQRPFLTLYLYPETKYAPNQKIYYLRSEAMERGEALGHASESFHNVDTTQLRTRSGKYIITIGQYCTQEQAEAALHNLERKAGYKLKLRVACGLADDIPEQ